MGSRGFRGGQVMAIGTPKDIVILIKSIPGSIFKKYLSWKKAIE
jgi:excinuclease UvrABC ATPase subunit